MLKERDKMRLNFVPLALFVSLFFLSGGESAKILFLIPMSTHSEKHFFSPIYTELANRGHQVILVTNQIGTVSHRNITDIVPCTVEDTFGVYSDTKTARDAYWPLIFQDMNALVPVWDKIYTNPEFKKLLNQKFDLVFANYYFGQAFHGLIHKLGAPFIMMNTLGVSNYLSSTTGYYMPPSHIPFPQIEYSDKMGFLERVMNFLVDWAVIIHAEFYHFPVMEGVYRKHLGEELPSIKEIDKNLSLILTNSHFLTNFHRPLMPDVVELGGIHCQPAKPVPNDLQKVVNSAASPEGFIYFSFGTILSPSSMQPELRDIFINVFSKLKQTVIWKWDGDHIPNLPKNIILMKWLPQQDLLGHPNISLFISHGGLLSLQQTIFHGVPAIMFPFFFDQVSNAKAISEKGGGIMLDLWSLTEEQLQGAINTVINDKRFNSKMQTLSSVFKHQLNTPKEKAMYWIEHVLQFQGAPHLRSSARELNLIQQRSLDIIAFLLALTLAIVCLLFVCMKNILNLFVKNELKEKVA